MYRNLIFVTLLLLLLVFWGCETTPTGIGFSSDAEAMKAMITDNPDGILPMVTTMVNKIPKRQKIAKRKCTLPGGDNQRMLI